MVGTFHYNFIILGKSKCDYTLLNSETFQAIIRLTDPILVDCDLQNSKVSALQLIRNNPDDPYFKNAKNGRLRWSVKSLLPVLERHRLLPPGDICLSCLDAEFPRIALAGRRGMSCEVFLRIFNDDPQGRARSDGDCGLLLSLREDIWLRLGEETVSRFLLEIRGLLY